MTLRTIIIDDEQFALDKLRSYVEQMPYLTLVGEFSGTTDALKFLSNEEVDVIFTDIEMPDMNGIRFVESVPGNPQIVFITAYRDFALDGFRLSATDYLVKPYDFTEFKRACDKVIDNYRRTHAMGEAKYPMESLFVKVETKFEKIVLSKILYIKGYGEYLQIYIADRRTPVMTISSFSEIMSRLGSCFIQVHRSYIANMDRVKRVEKNRIILEEDTEIPIGNTHRDSFLNYLRTCSIGKIYKSSSKKGGEHYV